MHTLGEKPFLTLTRKLDLLELKAASDLPRCLHQGKPQLMVRSGPYFFDLARALIPWPLAPFLTGLANSCSTYKFSDSDRECAKFKPLVSSSNKPSPIGVRLDD